jgi:hypothetical protein
MKLRTIVFLLLFSLLAATAFAQSAKETQAVRALEDRRIEAILKKDIKVLEELLAGDMTYGHSNGAAENKKVFIDNLRTGARTYTAIGRRDVNIRLYKNTALITGIAALKAALNGNPVNIGDVRFLAVWIKEKGKWKFAAWQSTRVP